jgi:hypothetical protein
MRARHLLDPPGDTRPAPHSAPPGLRRADPLRTTKTTGRPGPQDPAACRAMLAPLPDSLPRKRGRVRALAATGDLRLWNCRTAAGPVGAAFIAGPAQAAGADIAAATGRVGAAAQSGDWSAETTGGRREISPCRQPRAIAAGFRFAAP